MFMWERPLWHDASLCVCMYICVGVCGCNRVIYILAHSRAVPSLHTNDANLPAAKAFLSLHAQLRGPQQSFDVSTDATEHQTVAPTETFAGSLQAAIHGWLGRAGDQPKDVRLSLHTRVGFNQFDCPQGDEFFTWDIDCGCLFNALARPAAGRQGSAEPLAPSEPTRAPKALYDGSSR